jgi:DNA-binding MarR family transcriptional regulator
VTTTDRPPVLTPVPGLGDLGIVDALAQLSFAVQTSLGRIAAEHDLSIVHARLLGILRDRQPTITQLAGYLQLDKSSVTGLVDRAAERGLVTRVASPHDGRSVEVAITKAGRRLVEKATGAFERDVALLVGDLSPNQRSRLSTIASLIVAADAGRRGLDIFPIPLNRGSG